MAQGLLARSLRHDFLSCSPPLFLNLALSNPSLQFNDESIFNASHICCRPGISRGVHQNLNISNHHPRCNIVASGSSSASVTWTIIHVAEFRNWRETFSLFSLFIQLPSTYFSLLKKKKKKKEPTKIPSTRLKQRKDIGRDWCSVAKNKRCEQGVTINQGEEVVAVAAR